MDSSRTCYSICINTKVATHAYNFSAKAIELEDCVENWLSDAWFETYTVNCKPDDSEVTYEITAEEGTLIAKFIFMLAAQDVNKKVEMLKPKMRAAFMEASNNLFPTCGFTKKCAYP